MGIGGCGSGCGRWWLVAVDWVLQWVSVCFTVGFGGFQCVLQWVSMGSRSGLVSDGGGGLGILLMAVAGGGREGWLGCFCLGEKIHREREEEMRRIKKLYFNEMVKNIKILLMCILCTQKYIIFRKNFY